MAVHPAAASLNPSRDNGAAGRLLPVRVNASTVCTTRCLNILIVTYELGLSYRRKKMQSVHTPITPRQ